MSDVGVVVRELESLLSSAVKDLCVGKTGIVFSSGVDSTIVAVLASRFCDVRAFVAGFGGSADVECARSVARELDFPVEFIELNEGDVEAVLPGLIDIVGEPNPVKVGVGVPMYFTSKKASREGFKVMVCGQGGDELFGGYWRYLDAYVGEGSERVAEMMRSDVETADADNLDRDRAVCGSNGIELRFPYLDEGFLRYVGGLPLELKIREVDDSFTEFSCVDVVEGRRFVRKYVLKLLAREVGVPEAVINRGKKAAQYGSGVSRVLGRIAKGNGFKRPRDYLAYLIK
jgi:asparagine synthase (glutamine-hydrolysing)